MADAVRRGHRVLNRALIGLVLVAILALPVAARAHFATRYWELTACPWDWTRRYAPVSVVFYGSANSSTSLTLFGTYVGWTFTDATDRRFESHGDCGVNDWKRASLSAASLSVGSYRYMIQARHTLNADATRGLTVTAAVRRQKKVSSSCLRVNPATSTSSSGYDAGRTYVYKRLIGVPGIGFASTYWGNTATIHQCDGTNAGSNGYVHWFRVT